MKKLVFLLMMTCFFSAPIFAQISFSPVVGVNFANINTIGSEGRPGMVLRYAIGGQAGYKFNEKFAVGMGLQIATKGYDSSVDSTYFATEAYFKYFEVQPFAEYKPTKNLGVVLGCSIGALGKEEYKIGGKWVDPSVDLTENLDFAWVFGLKYHIKHAFVGLNLSQSLSPISELNWTDVNGNPGGKFRQFHQSFLLYAGYSFEVKKK